MKIDKRKAINDDLCKYDYLAKKDSFIEVVEWSNCEGITIQIDNKTIDLSYGELDAINYLSQTLKYNDKLE